MTAEAKDMPDLSRISLVVLIPMMLLLEILGCRTRYRRPTASAQGHRTVITRSQLRFATVMGIFGAITFLGVSLLTPRADVLAPVLGPLTTVTARVTLTFLQLCGMEAVQNGGTIASPHGFSYKITYGCVGLIPVASFVTAVLAYAAPFRPKLLGIVVGVPILLALNLVRLIHLYYLGVNRSALFDFFHETVWNSCLILSIIILWLTWVRWSDAQVRKTNREATSGGAEFDCLSRPACRCGITLSAARLLGGREHKI
jgi:exosortase H (IPTLxxWG-CTERM-specific)